MFFRKPPLKDIRVYDLETNWGVKQTTFKHIDPEPEKPKYVSYSRDIRLVLSGSPEQRIKSTDSNSVRLKEITKKLGDEEAKRELVPQMSTPTFAHCGPAYTLDSTFSHGYPEATPFFASPAVSCPYGITNHNCDEGTKHNKVTKSLELKWQIQPV